MEHYGLRQVIKLYRNDEGSHLLKLKHQNTFFNDTNLYDERVFHDQEVLKKDLRSKLEVSHIFPMTKIFSW